MESTPVQKERDFIIKEVTGLKKGPQAMRIALEICARCGTCAQVCPVYNGKPDPRYNPVLRVDRIRSIYKKHATLTGKMLGGLAGAHDYKEGEIQEWAETFYECTGCRRCATFCPMKIDHSIMTRKARSIIHKLGLTPKRLLTVTDISLKMGNTDGATPEGFLDSIKFLEEEMKEESGIDIPLPVDQVGAEIFFVPPSADVLVNPEAIMGIAKVFYDLKLKWTMSSKIFDGANYGLFTGDDEAMKQENLNQINEAKRLQCKVLMMGECGHAHRIMKFMMEKQSWWGKLPFDITSVLEFTADVIRQGKIRLDPSKNPAPVTYHDPCNFARSCGLIEEPRVLLKASCQDFREMTPNGAENWCCGGGAGLSAMDSIRDFRMTVSGKKKMEQIRATGAKYVAASCSNCKRQLTQLMEHHKEDIGVGGILDLISRSLVLQAKP